MAFGTAVGSSKTLTRLPRPCPTEIGRGSYNGSGDGSRGVSTRLASARLRAGATPHDPLSDEALVDWAITRNVFEPHSNTQRTQINEETA